LAQIIDQICTLIAGFDVHSREGTADHKRGDGRSPALDPGAGALLRR
jgi:hypothetical protein